MPTEEDDNDHDVTTTTTIPPTTVTPPPGFHTPGELPSTTPTDHPDRPINSKPTTLPTGTTGDEELSATSTPGSSWLPGFLPTFGVSPRTQAWIYSSIALILAFCAGLGVYLFLARRKRLRNSPRDSYEFELLDEEEAEGLTAGGEKLGGVAGAGGEGGRKKRTRGGELYDAFAGGSDEEDDEFYRDNAEGGSGSNSSDVARREKRALGVEDEEEEQHVLGSDSEDEGDEREALRGGRR